jgi:HlyD family secretion protein
LTLALVQSPQTGQILKIHTFAGERVGEKGIVALGNTQQMDVVAEVYETDIHKVAIGQQATIKSQGLSSELSGKVTEIGLQIGKKDVLGTDPAADSDVRVVEVKISLDPDSSQKVRTLTNLQVNVIIHL